MAPTYSDLQCAFTRMSDQFDDYQVSCRELVSVFREDLASCLGIRASEIKFLRPEDSNEKTVDSLKDVADGFNDPFDAGELVRGGFYRIRLRFGISPVGESNTAWHLVVPLQLARHSGNFTLKVESLNHTFELGQLPVPEEKIRDVSEWLLQHFNELAENMFERFISGNQCNEIGIHTLFSKRA